MDLACAYRLSHPRLRPHNRVDARFGWPAVPQSDRRGLHRDGLVRSADHHDCLQTPRTLGLVRLVVLPALLDGAPLRRVAARKRSHPPGRAHRTLPCGPAASRTRVLPAKESTATHDLLKFRTQRTSQNAVERKSNFAEFPFHALRCIRARRKARAARTLALGSSVCLNRPAQKPPLPGGGRTP